VVPDLGLLTLSVHLSDDLIKVGISVHGLPERLTVLGVVSTTVVLLSAVVDEWDTTTSQREDDSVAELGVTATVIVEETRVIVVVNEKTKSINVLEVGLFSVVTLLEVSHVLTATKDVADGIVHRVVEKSGDGTLVRSDVSRVAVEALTHLENTSSLAKLRPEVFRNLRNGVNSKTIEAIGINHKFDPVLELATDVIVRLIKIRQVSKSAVFNLPLVVPVVNLAVVVVVVGLVER
jgi:hypothetical protein